MAPFDHDTTAEEIANECASRIVNKTILVTGASPGGLGAAFATIVAKYGPAAIVLATRDISKAEETARDVTTVAPNVRTHAIELDLSSIEQVRKAAEKINSLDEHIDVIVNNAGIMAPPYSETVDGIESQFATNHVGHFLLTNLMLPKILAEKRPVRVVSVTSGGFRFGPPRFEDWNFDDGKAYNRWKAYGQSKSANMLFSVALARKLGRRGLVSAALHPGVIQTGLARNLDMSDIEEFVQLDDTNGDRSFWNPKHQFKTPSQGVATHVFAAFHPGLDSPDLNGSYLIDSNVVKPEVYQSWARDLTDAERLWALSEKLVNQKFDYSVIE